MNRPTTRTGWPVPVQPLQSSGARASFVPKLTLLGHSALLRTPCGAPGSVPAPCNHLLTNGKDGWPVPVQPSSLQGPGHFVPKWPFRQLDHFTYAMGDGPIIGPSPAASSRPSGDGRSSRPTASPAWPVPAQARQPSVARSADGGPIRLTLIVVVGRSPVGILWPEQAHPGPLGLGITCSSAREWPLRHCLRCFSGFYKNRKNRTLS